MVIIRKLVSEKRSEVYDLIDVRQFVRQCKNNNFGGYVMKKIMVLLLTLIMVFALAACGGGTGGEKSTQDSSSEKTSDTSSDDPKDEVKIYGIGEVAEADGYAITVDKVETPDPNMFLNGPKDGFTYIQVYFTLKNISKDTIKTPRRQAIYIVYDEKNLDGYGEMTSDISSEDVLPGAKGGIYEGSTELAPGESTNGWMIYPRESDKTEVLMHYYTRFLNEPPAAVFGFTAP